MAKLSEKEGCGELGERVAETHEETTGHEVVEVLCGSLDGSADNHDNAANGDGSLTAIVIGDERGDG